MNQPETPRAPEQHPGTGKETRNLKHPWLVAYMPPSPLRFRCEHCGYTWKRELPHISPQAFVRRLNRLALKHRNCKEATR